MSKTRELIISIFLFISIPLILLLTTVDIVVFDTDYYIEKYEEYNITDETGIKIEDLKEITVNLLNYLQDKSDNLVMFKEVNNSNEQVFESKEIKHLEDVKLLFIKGYFIRNILLVLSLILILYLLFKNKKLLLSILFYSSLFTILLIFILYLLISSDFNKYFTYFHEIFFTNDLWLLNPKTDILIQMYPLDFFFDISFKIILYYVITLLTIMIFSFSIKKRIKRY